MSKVENKMDNLESMISDAENAVSDAESAVSEVRMAFDELNNVMPDMDESRLADDDERQLLNVFSAMRDIVRNLTGENV